MSLPPERLSIKRRRDEDPVDKLYIDEAEPSTKRIITRRFTEYYFQRVPANTPTDSPLHEPCPQHTQRILRTPKSVNSLNVANSRTRAFKPNGVPIVRATTPGDEFRDAQRILDARREAADIFTNARNDAEKRKEKHQNTISVIPDRVVPIYKSSSGIESMQGDEPNSPEESVVRRFRITPYTGLGGGIQKNRVRKVGNGIAVLVEQERISSSRRSPVTELLSQQVDTQMQLGHESTEVFIEASNTPPRKRPVVNKAELKWRQEQHRTVSSAKFNIASAIEKKAREKNTTWDEQADRLAQEFEQVALDIEEQDKAELSSSRQVPLFQAPKYIASKPKQHKFKPHQPIKPRGVPPKVESVESKPMNTEPKHAPKVESEPQHMDTETDYVVDMFIRIPMTESDGLMNPLSGIQDQTSKDPRVGLITITAEDQEIWDDFAEDEEDEKWDSEDADSNAEDNPANEYPDEPSDDEESDDDGTAKEWRNRYNRAFHGRSNPLSGYDCEEEYDYECDDYDDGVQFAGWRDDADYDSNVESD